MESIFDGTYRDRKVLVTGHTGFKGAWLSAWLVQLGAHVAGYALAPPAGRPSLFEGLGLDANMHSVLGDVRDAESVKAAFDAWRPEVVFHLAAQSLVRQSYADPVATMATNVLGTVHVLEAARHASSVQAVVVVTTDKVYENETSGRPHHEEDPLGGHDPYSASKAAAEIVTSSYRRAYFSTPGPGGGPAVATARSGNVIGGGDWARDRLVPDAMRALMVGDEVAVRRPGSVRPWQHVTEPLSGYLWLGSRLMADPERFTGAWNFGPDAAGDVTARELVDRLIDSWGEGSWRDVSGDSTASPHEASALRLDVSKAADELRWRSIWSLSEAVDATVAWYHAFNSDERFDAPAFTVSQIEAYVHSAKKQGAPWAIGVTSELTEGIS